MGLQYNSFENTVGKGEIAHNEQFLLFLQRFLPFQRSFHYFNQILNCPVQTLSVWKSLKSIVVERVKSVTIDKILSQTKLEVLATAKKNKLQTEM